MLLREFAPQHILDRLVNKDTTSNQIEWSNLSVEATVGCFYKRVPETSLTILTNDKGTAHIKVDGKDLKLCNSTYVILNPFQTLEYTIDAVPETVKTLNFHFNFSFSQSAFQDLESMLEDPETSHMGFPVFHNELLYKNKSVQKLLNQLGLEDESNHDLVFSEILQHLRSVQISTNHKIELIDCIKKSTRKELFDRLSLAKDMIYAEYSEELSIDEISRRAMLSKYHLIRCFKAFYGCTPYDMLKTVRLEKSRELLSDSSYSVGEIASLVGFRESNSFSNAFKTTYKITPSAFRISNIE